MQDAIAATRAAALALSASLGQLEGRTSWLGVDFVAGLVTRLDELELQATAGALPSTLEATLREIETNLREMAKLIAVAAEAFDTMIAAAKSALAVVPRSN